MSSIKLNNQYVSTSIGVTEEERGHYQTLKVTTELFVSQSFNGIDDQLESTIDYAEVALLIQQVAQEKSRKLLEQLADEITQKMLKTFCVDKVTIGIEKFILPQMESVCIRHMATKDSL